MRHHSSKPLDSRLEGCGIKAHAQQYYSHTPLMGYFILQGKLFNRLHTTTGVTFVENCMSSDLSPHRIHSTIPFHHSIPPFHSMHHSSPVIVDYLSGPANIVEIIMEFFT